MLFQPSAVTGGGFLILVGSQSPGALLMCLTGAVASTLCAYMLEYPDRAYFDGEGGFNGGLLGLALAAFYEPGAALLLMAVLGGVLTELVRAGLLRLLPVPPFTAPFVLVAWPAFLGAWALALAPLDMPVVDHWSLYAVVTNASQVLFILHPWVGLMVLLAVVAHSRSAALWIAGSSLIAWLVVVLFSLPADLAAAGLLGYNALILAAALQHRGTHWLLFTAGVMCSVWVSYLFFRVDVTPLSAPFVLSAWLVIAVERLFARRPA